MEVDFKKYERKLANLYEINEHDCHIWTKCTRGKYGRINTQLISGCWHTMNAHRLKYMVVHRMSFMQMEEFDVSHLCHTPLCINIEHLSLEPSHVNLSREKCFNRGKCDGHAPFAGCRLLSFCYVSIITEILAIRFLQSL